MVKESTNSIEFIYCYCGCGKTRSKYELQNGKPRKDRIKKYIDYHFFKVNKFRFIGEKHGFWKGGRFQTRGYILVRNNGKYIQEHRLIWEQHHKACLLPWADVHHINGAKDDNRIENLKAMTCNNHSSHHLSIRNRRDMTGRKCLVCGTEKTYIRKNGNALWKRHPFTSEEWICDRCYSRLVNHRTMSSIKRLRSK